MLTFCTCSLTLIFRNFIKKIKIEFQNNYLLKKSLEKWQNNSNQIKHKRKARLFLEIFFLFKVTFFVFNNKQILNTRTSVQQQQYLITNLISYSTSFMSEEEQPKQICQVSLKRRGRPQKKLQSFQSLGIQMFTIHDNVFHASVLYYTSRIFDKTPSRAKFNPTIGFSVYQKVRNVPQEDKKYYDDDQVAIKQSKSYEEYPQIVNFFINSLTFGPTSVVNQFYQLFHFILKNEDKVTSQDCLQFIKQNTFKYMCFQGPVLKYLNVKNNELKKQINEVIQKQLKMMCQILIYTLKALKSGSKKSIYQDILQNQDEKFERGLNTKDKKKVKTE